MATKKTQKRLDKLESYMLSNGYTADDYANIAGQIQDRYANFGLGDYKFIDKGNSEYTRTGEDPYRMGLNLLQKQETGSYDPKRQWNTSLMSYLDTVGNQPLTYDQVQATIGKGMKLKTDKNGNLQTVIYGQDGPSDEDRRKFTWTQDPATGKYSISNTSNYVYSAPDKQNGLGALGTLAGIGLGFWNPFALGSIANGALAGAVGGGLSSGSIDGVLKGGVLGGLTGGAMDYFGGGGAEGLNSFDDGSMWNTISSSGVEGGDLLNLLDGYAGGGGSSLNFIKDAALSGNYSIGDLANMASGFGLPDVAKSILGTASSGGGGMGSLNWGNVIGAGMGLLDSGDKEMTATSKSAPWKPMQPYILDAAERVSKSLPENPSAEQMAIYNAYMNNVGGLQNLGMQANQGYFDPILERVNDISDPSNPNPYIDGVAQAIAQKSNRNLMENIMPGIRSGAVANGYGSSRQGIAEGLAMRDTQNQINESIAPLYMQGYENWQNRMMQADQFNANLGLNRNNQNISASQIALNNRMQPMQTAYNALLGGFGMADNMNNYDFNQAQRYAGTMASLGGLGGQQTTSQPLYQNTMGNVLGGAMLGNSLYNWWNK